MRAFLGRARIVVFDEPTAALGSAESSRLFDAIARLRRDGVAVIYVSHRLEEVLSICDRATVLRDGAVVATERCENLDTSAVIALMSGPRAASSPVSRKPPGAAVLTLPEAGIAVHAGEIVGLYGLLGAGPAPRATLREKPYAPCSPAAAIRHGVVLVPEDRAAQGLVLN